MELSGVIGGLAAAVLTPVVLRHISAAKQPARQAGEYRVLEFGVGYQVLMLLCCVVFTSFALLAWRFPGRTDPAQLPFIIAFFLLFALFGALSLIWMGRAAVFWNHLEVQGADTWGRRATIFWDELKSAEYVAWAQCVRLQGRIWVSPAMKGFAEFQDKLQTVCRERELSDPMVSDP